MIRATILDTEFTVASLAEASGYSRAHISRVFRRLDSPSPSCIHRLARFLQMPDAKLAALLKTPRRPHFTPPARKRPPMPRLAPSSTTRST